MHILRFTRIATLLGVLLAGGMTIPANAHHGWAWAETKFSQIDGVIKSIYIGNPHVTIDADVGGKIWRIELAPLGPTTAAGFTKDAAAIGDKITAIGNRSLDKNETRMKAVRVIVRGHNYDVYPDRAKTI
jgi:hypothetical protein